MSAYTMNCEDSANIKCDILTQYPDIKQNNINKSTKFNLLDPAFAELESSFEKHGWHMIKNETEQICYTKLGFETDFFEIRCKYNSIIISVPVKNSRFQYVTSFDDRATALAYIYVKILFLSTK